MKEKITYNFNYEKNRWLIENRGVSFEEIIAILDSRGALDVIEHYNFKQYPNQEIIVVDIQNYVYIVPFVDEGNNTLFLKTIFPHRKFTKKYLGDQP